MIVVNAAMRGDEIVEHILALPDMEISFIRKDGMKYLFASNNEQKDSVTIKNLLKQNQRFSTLYTSVAILP